MRYQKLWISALFAWSSLLWAGPRFGEPVSFHPPEEAPGLQYFGGPDADGWYYIDSREPDGPAYNYIWVTNNTNITGDDAGGWLHLPFSFPYRGRSYDSVFVCTNGFISFTSTSTTPNNTPLPNPSAPNDAIYVYWDDLVIDSGFSAIRVGTVGSAPNRRYVIRWYRPKHYPDYYGGADFEVVLYETGEILINLRNTRFGLAAFDEGASATIGIENADGTVGLLYAYNDTTRVDNELAILFYRPDSVFNVAPVALETPSDNQPTGVATTPRARVTNVGTETASFYTVLALYPFGASSPVYRDSTFVSHLAPGDTVPVTFSAWTPGAAGRYRALLFTRLVNDDHPENDTLNQVFVAGTPGTNFLILDLNPLHTDGRRVYEVLQQQGHAGWYTQSIAYFDSLSAYSTVWCLLGVFPDKHILTVYQAVKLRNYLEAGGRLLLQSGDAFGEDPTRDTLAPYFGINTDRTSDGSTPVGILYGLDNPLIPEITAQDTWAYYGGREHLDSLVLLSPTDARVAPVMQIAPFYPTLVAYQGTRWNTVVSTVELTPVEQEEGLRSAEDQRLITALMNFLTGDLYTFHDVQPLAFRHPPGSAIPYNEDLYIRVAVRNAGTFTESSVPVYLEIYRKADSTDFLATPWVFLYGDTVTLTHLAPGDTVVAAFDPFRMSEIYDTLLLVARTGLADDAVPDNDSLDLVVHTHLTPGDLLRVIFLNHRTGSSENYGAAFDGTYFYVSTHTPAGNFLVVLDDTGGVVASLSQPTTGTGYRDLAVWREPGDTIAWILAGTGNLLHRLKLVGFHTLVLDTTFATPVNPVRAVALDPERRRYFVASGTSPVVELNRRGTVLSHLVPGREVYGLAFVPALRGWWNPHLWISAVIGDTLGFRNRLYRWDLATQSLTDSLMPAAPPEVTATYPGGLSHRMIYRGRVVLVELVQAEPSDYLQVVYLGDASWDRKCGDANDDGYATWSDFDAFSRYLFLDDSLANPMALDVNGDYQANPLDLRYLARYLFDEADSLYCRQNSR